MNDFLTIFLLKSSVYPDFLIWIFVKSYIKFAIVISHDPDFSVLPCCCVRKCTDWSLAMIRQLPDTTQAYSQLEIEQYGFFRADADIDKSAMHGPIANISKIIKS